MSAGLTRSGGAGDDPGRDAHDVMRRFKGQLQNARSFWDRQSITGRYLIVLGGVIGGLALIGGLVSEAVPGEKGERSVPSSSMEAMRGNVPGAYYSPEVEASNSVPGSDAIARLQARCPGNSLGEIERMATNAANIVNERPGVSEDSESMAERASILLAAFDLKGVPHDTCEMVFVELIT